MEELFFLDGKRVGRPPALRALLYGEGVFETFRRKGAPPVFFSRHMERMRRGAAFLGIPFPRETRIAGAVEAAAESAAADDLRVRVSLLGEGDSGFGTRPGGSSLFVSVSPRPAPPEAFSLVVCEERRPRGNGLFSHKTTNYLENVIGKRQALAQGFDDVLFLDTCGQAAETSCHNVFWAGGGKLFTPSLDGPVLPGVTREAVLRIAGRLGYEAVCGSFPLEELLSCDFAFLTNAVAGIVYVKAVEEREMPSAPPAYDIIRKELFSELGW